MAKRIKNTPSEIRRLSFIRQLYLYGDELSKKGEAISAAAVLTFHDAVELMLVLMAEHVDAPAKSNTDFLAYWDLLNIKLPPEQKIGYKIAMGRLNAARVSLKHKGNLPSAQDVEDFRSATLNLLRDSTLAVFGVNFDELSLTHLIPSEAVKKEIEDAETKLTSGDLQDSLAHSARAFRRLVREHESQYKDRFGRTKFIPKENFSFKSSYFLKLDRLDRDFANGWDSLINSVDSMQTIIRILALGLDYKKFVLFDRLTPSVMSALNGSMHVTFGPQFKVSDIKKEDCQFCIDFVVDAALLLAAKSDVTYQGP